MLMQAKTSYVEQTNVDTQKIYPDNKTASENEYALMKAQADMLATELAREKVTLERFNRHICQKSDECETLELIVSYLMSKESGTDIKNVDLQNRNILLIGGTPAYGKVIEYFVNSMGGKISYLSSKINAEELCERSEQISQADMVMFQSNTFSELELWNATRIVCENVGTKFTILTNATISCFSNRVSAAFRRYEPST